MTSKRAPILLAVAALSLSDDPRFAPFLSYRFRPLLCGPQPAEEPIPSGQEQRFLVCRLHTALVRATITKSNSSPDITPLRR